MEYKKNINNKLEVKESIQNTATAFKRSFLDHLESLENITKEDIQTLQKSGYLINNNMLAAREITIYNIVCNQCCKRLVSFWLSQRRRRRCCRRHHHRHR